MAPLHSRIWQEYTLSSGIILNNLDLSVPRLIHNINLSTWSPKPDGDGKYRYWGLNPVSDPKRNRFTRDKIASQAKRVFDCKDFYPSPHVNPELQLSQRIADRKIALLKSTKTQRKPMYRKLFLLRVQLDDLSTPVYRDVYVSGGTALRTLADKILQPTMGWDRSYHR